MNEKAIELSETIDRYLRGRMSEKEEQNFNKRLKEDATLRQQTEENRVLMQAMQYQGLREEVSVIRGQMLSEEDVSRELEDGHVINIWSYAGKIAAGILIALMAYGIFSWFSLSGEKLYTEQVRLSLNAYATGELQNRDESSTRASDQMQQLYRDNEYQQLLQTYQQLAEPTAVQAYIAANTYLQLRQTTQAIETYQSILDDPGISDELLLYRTRLNLVAAYVRQGEYDQALQLIESQGDSYLQEQISGIDRFRIKALRLKEKLF
jgi:hypothetical protein